MTFRPIKGHETDTEMYLEQPQGNFVLPKLGAASGAADASAAATASYSGPYKELLGSYEKDSVTIEIAVRDGQVALVVPGQSPYPLAEKEHDVFGTGALPDSYRMLVKRDASGAVSGIVIKQPEGENAFTRVATAAAVSVDDVLAKAVAAAGGEANIRKHTSRLVTATIDMENEGVTADTVIRAKAPNASATTMTLQGLGKNIGTIRDYYDGTSGGEETSFSLPDVMTERQLQNARFANDFYQLLDWKTLFKTTRVKGMSKVGDEDAYVVEGVPEKGDPVTIYVSTKSFLVLRRQTVLVDGNGNGRPVSDTYSDYRTVDGVMVPFTITTERDEFGTLVTRVKDITFGATIPDTEFRAK
jgi:hypothetical protein